MAVVLLGGLSGVKAQEEPSNDGIYYLYNEEAGLFLARGNNWGTQAVAMPVGMPWKVTVSDGTYTLRMYDLTVAGSTNGFGSNGYTDNGSPIAFTPSGSATDGYTLLNGSNYITCPASAGAVSLSTTASKWKFLTQAQYTAVLSARATTQDAAIAELKGVTIPDGSTLDDVVNDADNWTVSSTVNDGTPTSSTWTVTGVNSRGGTQDWNTSYGGEIYQGGGRYTRTITGLKQGIYKVAVRAQKRVGTNANCYTMGQAGYPVSDAYLSANGYIIPIQAWYESCSSNSNPNSTGDFVTIVNNGGYTNEGYVYVGSEGTLELAAVSEAYWGASWFLFNGISYTYYNNELSDEDAAAILSEVTTALASPMNADAQTALTTAQAAFEASQTIANYNALNTALTNANTSIDNYAAALEILNAASTLDEAGQASYAADETVAALQTAYDARSLEAVTSEQETACASALQTAAKAQTTEGADMTLAITNPTVLSSKDGWTCTGNGNMPFVYGQAFEFWTASPASAYFDYYQSITGLPAGKYTISAEMTYLQSTPGDDEVGVYGISGASEVSAGVKAATAGDYTQYTTDEITVTNGTLRIGVKNIGTMGGQWVVTRNFTLTFVEGISLQECYDQISSLITTAEGITGTQSTETSAELTAAVAEGQGYIDDAETNIETLTASITRITEAISASQTSVEEFARGEAMNALISGNNSVVLTDEATAANWSPTPTYNNWSTEADESGMETPFLQDWVAKGRYLSDNSHDYLTIRGVQDGYYEVSALVRIYSESGSEPSATSATFTVNGESVDLLDGTSFEYNSMLGVYKTVSVKMQIEDALSIGIAYSGAAFNWIAWKNLKVTYIASSGDEADEDDYTALNTAISEANAKTLGFQADQYAPYNNIDALTALAAAEAIDQTDSNLKAIVEEVTETLANATWTANTEEVDAVYNGSFAQGQGSAAANIQNYGWTRTNVWGQFQSGIDGTYATAYYNQPGSLQSGNAGYYTMPLEAETIYELKFAYRSHESGSNNGVTVSVLNDYNEGLAATAYDANASTTEWAEESVFFKTGEAGNYVLTLANSGNTWMTGVSIKTASEAVEVPMTITKAKFATFCAPFDVTIPDGVEAYTVEDVSGNALDKTQITDGTIPANTPVLIWKDVTDTYEKSFFGMQAEGVTTCNEGVLIGVFQRTAAPVGCYGLQYNSTTKKVTFNKVESESDGVMVGAYRAYLTVESNARTLYINDGDDTTGINSLEATTAVEDLLSGADIYDLNGRKVNGSLQKGKVYIVNGKKLYVK